MIIAVLRGAELLFKIIYKVQSNTTFNKCRYSDMFRLIRVIIRLSFELCLRCTINSAHFGIPKSLHGIGLLLSRISNLLFKASNNKLDIRDNNSPKPCKLFGIRKCALFIVRLQHGSKDSLMMTRMSRNMSL